MNTFRHGAWSGRHLAGVLVLLLGLCGGRSGLAGESSASAPLAMVLTYHVLPVNRVAFRQIMEQTEIPRFQRWKAEGLLQEARVIFSRHADGADFDAMVLLSFAQASGGERWKQIERVNPAGLSAAALALTTAVETTPGDWLRQGGALANNQSKEQPSPTFLAVPYQYLVPLNEYVDYLDGYVIPQMQGWIDEKVLSRYSIFLARYPAGRSWQSLLLLEYRDDAALGARDATTAKVRSRLKENPQWKAISDAKKNVRSEKPAVIADLLSSPQD